MNSYPRPLPFAPNIRRVELAHLAGIAFGFEAIAILTKKMPTLSTVCRRHRVLAFPILVGLAVHLLRAPPDGIGAFR